MKRIMIAAMESGSGKTIMTGTIIRALQMRGIEVSAFKCGPDYIDPMFHKKILSAPCRNLDVFLQGEKRLRQTVCTGRGNIAVIESAMGFYDGIGGGPEGSGWHIADITETPVILVVRPRGSSLTLAAQIKGLCDFRRCSHIAGVILNCCREGLYQHMKKLIEKETGLPVIGFLPEKEEAKLPSRHLGLYTADEIKGLKERFTALAKSLEEHAQLGELLAIADQTERELCAGNLKSQLTHPVSPAFAEITPRSVEDRRVNGTPEDKEKGREKTVRIAVAKDEAFSFYYEDNIEALINEGSEIVYFSPISDKKLPQADGLYIGGGYPELFLKELSANESMRSDIKNAIENGLPTIAECGGFMYLQESICGEDGEEYPMVGALEGRSYNEGRLTRFGYLHLLPDKDSMLFKKGERIPAHEFHYWNSTAPGEDDRAKKPDGREWRCCVTSGSIYAGFPHLYMNGEINLAQRFVAAAVKYGENRHGSFQ